MQFLPPDSSVVVSRPGRPVPRSALEALCDGVRLSLLHLRLVLPITLLGWVPGELVRLAALLLPQSPEQRAWATALAMLLSLLGTGFVSAAVVGMLARPGRPLGRAEDSVDAVVAGLGRMQVVVRTQLLLLALLGALLLPLAVVLYLAYLRERGAGAPLVGGDWLALGLLVLTAPLASLLGLRCALAMTAAAADKSPGACGRCAGRRRCPAAGSRSCSPSACWWPGGWRRSWPRWSGAGRCSRAAGTG